MIVSKLQGFSCEVLCAIFNSKLGQFYYNKKFNSLKVLKANLQSFPLPSVQPQKFKKIKTIVNQLEAGSDSRLSAQLDELVLSLYDLSIETKNIIMAHQSSKAFN